MSLKYAPVTQTILYMVFSLYIATTRLKCNGQEPKIHAGCWLQQCCCHKASPLISNCLSPLFIGYHSIVQLPCVFMLLEMATPPTTKILIASLGIAAFMIHNVPLHETICWGALFPLNNTWWFWVLPCSL